jgi:predicted kinase
MVESALNFDTLADDTIRTLNVPEPTFAKPLCIIMVGIPASGKSTLTQKLSEKFPLTVFDEESLTSFLSPRATVFKRGSVEVFKLATKTIEHLLRQGKPCIYDANVKTRQQRDLIKKIVEECGGSWLLIYLNCPEDLCYERLQKHNLAVTRGESKGFILDKDFFEYEVSGTSAPSLDELHIVFNCNNPEDSFKITSQVESGIDKRGS